MWACQEKRRACGKSLCQEWAQNTLGGKWGLEPEYHEWRDERQDMREDTKTYKL